MRRAWHWIIGPSVEERIAEERSTIVVVECAVRRECAAEIASAEGRGRPADDRGRHGGS
jgi:hypothetical protein